MSDEQKKIASSTIRELAKLSLSLAGFSFFPVNISFTRQTNDSIGKDESKITIREQQLLLLKDLSSAKIDPNIFDRLLSNELDRNLKKQFGIAFFAATVFFTITSYLIITTNNIFKFGISDISISILLAETPLQFIGLLYIIARNLFPQHSDSQKRGERIWNGNEVRNVEKRPPRLSAMTRSIIHSRGSRSSRERLNSSNKGHTPEQ